MPQPMFTVGDLYAIIEAIDRPQGSFARVYSAKDLKSKRLVAFKVLRPEHLDLDLAEKRPKFQAFANEAELLTIFADDPNVMQIFNFGFIEAIDSREFKPILCDTLEEFKSLIGQAIAKNWRPFLAVEQLDNHDSLFRLINNNPRGLRFPTEEALAICLQLAKLLVRIHEKDIVYWDAKAEHVYWSRIQGLQGIDQGRLVLIDWNVSRLLKQKDSKDVMKRKQEDILHFGQGVIFPAFVGLDYQTGRTPQAQPTSSFDKVATRYSDKKLVEFYSQDSWLDEPVKQMLRRAVTPSSYRNSHALLDDVQNCAVDLGWNIDGKDAPDPKSQEARQEIADGIALLNSSEENLRKAIEHFERAMDKNPINNREILRLIDIVTDSLNKRLVP